MRHHPRMTASTLVHPSVLEPPPSEEARLGPAPADEARLGRGDAALVLVASAGFVAFPFAGSARPLFTLLFALLGAVGFARRVRPLATLGTFGTLFLVALSIPVLQNYWPLPVALAALAFAVLCRVTPLLRDGLSFLRRGRLDRLTVVGIVGSSAVAATALVIWFALVRPDYSAVRAALFPALPWPLLMAGVVVFAMVNGALEELIYRGVLLSALDTALGVSALSLALQAIAFGAIHIHGFPSGAAGVGLASIYGLMMGIVRRQARGMLGPWLAHVCADVAIGAILVATR
jgi:hypothetical protein